MRRPTSRWWLPLAAAAILVPGIAGLASLAAAGAPPPAVDEYDFGNTAYDGRFVFVRLRYDMSFSQGFSSAT